MTALTDEALAELERLQERRTPGPWRWWTSNSHRRLSSDATGKDGDVAYGVRHRDGCTDIAIREEDAAYVEGAANALPDLLREVRRLRAVEAAARGWAESVEQGFASGIRPDVARARLLRALEAK